MTGIGERWYRFRLFAARNAIPLVWLWAGTMLCGLGTVYYRLKKGEKATSEFVIKMSDKYSSLLMADNLQSLLVTYTCIQAQNF